MTKLIVDGIEVEVPAEYTLLQACEAAGAEIPRFCFHERLSIAGNCRMCLVELKGAPKPVASCAWAVRDCRPGPNGEPPVINTAHADGQEGARGGDGVPAHQPPARLPDLRPGRRMRSAGPGHGLRGRHDALPREQARRRGQVYRPARQDLDEPVHPLHALHPLRRRGRRASRISAPSGAARTWRSRPISRRRCAPSCRPTSPISARSARLTHKPQAFNYRPWELSKTPSVDVMDAVGSAIRVDARGREVMRILPRVNEAMNEEWISDKTRQVVDGLRLQRLDRPFLRENGRLRPASWPEAFAAIAGRMQGLDAEAHRRHRRRSCRGRGDLRAQAADAEPRRHEHRLPPGRRAASPRSRPRLLSLQPHHRRHRERRRHPDHRRQSAGRGLARQCAHPQALARRTAVRSG